MPRVYREILHLLEKTFLDSYIQSGLPETNQWDAARTFDVLLEEVPVEIVQVCMRHMHETNGANFSIGVARFSQSDGAFFSTAMAQISEFSGAIFRVFNLLSSIKLLKQIVPPNIEPKPVPDLGADAPVCPVQKTEESRISDFPQELQEGARLMQAVFNVKPPERPNTHEKGGDFALWVIGLRALLKVAREYGVPLEKAMQLTHRRWNERPFDVAHPGALKKTMTSVLAQYTSRTKTQKSGVQDIPQSQPVLTGASVALPNSSLQARMEALRARKNHPTPGELA